MQRKLAPFLLLLAVITVVAWWLPNRAQNPQAGSPAARFNSLSYTPTRPGNSPLEDHFATQAEADQDLAQLATITGNIRSYSAIEGPYDVAALAQRHGLHLWQGIWLGGNRAENARQMARGIELAHRYPATIDRLVVGNEVLLRRDLPVDELIADIEHVRSSVRQKVAYADVSDFWDQFPQVAPHVDVVMVHLLPYWEDVPTGIDHAVAAVGDVYTHFTKLFPGRPIVIGETGWPGRGRQRADAVPGRINEARFVRGFMAQAAARHFDYNLFQAYDENWKYQNEGVIGPNWGIFSADRTPKIPPSGPLREDPFWAWHAAFSIAAGLVLTAMGLRGRAPGEHSPTPAQTALFAMTLGAALGYAESQTLPVLYDWHARLAGVANLSGQVLLAGLMMRRDAGAIAPADWRTGADATRRIRQYLRLRHAAWPGLFEDLVFLFAWAAAVDQILLVFDPRYRDFPLATYAVPLVIVAARIARADLPRGMGGREEWALALALTIGAVASAVQEGMLNGQSLRWNACVLVLAWPFWRSVRKEAVLF